MRHAHEPALRLPRRRSSRACVRAPRLRRRHVPLQRRLLRVVGQPAQRLLRGRPHHVPGPSAPRAAPTTCSAPAAGCATPTRTAPATSRPPAPHPAAATRAAGPRSPAASGGHCQPRTSAAVPLVLLVQPAAPAASRPAQHDSECAGGYCVNGVCGPALGKCERGLRLDVRQRARYDRCPSSAARTADRGGANVLPHQGRRPLRLPRQRRFHDRLVLGGDVPRRAAASGSARWTAPGSGSAGRRSRRGARGATASRRRRRARRGRRCCSSARRPRRPPCRADRDRRAPPCDALRPPAPPRRGRRA